MDEQEPIFPATDLALDDPDGLLAIGGRLDTRTLLRAYSRGIFPWFQQGQPILWWSPSQRAVVEPGAEHVSRSLAKLIRKGEHRLTANHCFDEVVAACAAPRDAEGGTWITPQMQRAYGELHRAGRAHSVECWHGNELAGGLYGVQVGGVFCGESMFSRRSNASKLAFVGLSRALARAGFSLIDCQLENPHLLTLGITMIPRERFLHILAKGADQAIHWPGSDEFQRCLDQPAANGNQ